jgi:serine/threonine-protein kinase
MSPSTRTHAVPGQIPVGAVIGGKYRIDALLAEGGMGVVYRGTHLVLEQPVAIKLVRPELTHRKDAIARFLREARTIAALRGEHVARVLDSGCIKSGPPYMVLEYLEGADFRTWLQSKGPLAIPRAADLLLQACEGLAEAHAKGLVHRDVKPENLFLTRLPDGSELVKVLDFGISKRMNDQRALSHAADGQSLGSPHYMAPEQMSAPADVDARADVWSLGVVLFELISGRLPFDGESVTTVCARVICRAPRPLRALRPEAPAALEGAISRCLSKRPADRFASVVELAEALVPFATADGTDSLARIRRLSGAQPLPAFELSRVSTAPEHPTLAVASSMNLGPVRRRRSRIRSVVTALVAALIAMAVPNLSSLHAGARYVAAGVATAARGFSAPIVHERSELPERVESVTASPEVAQDSRSCSKSERMGPPISPEQLPLESSAVPATVVSHKVAQGPRRYRGSGARHP